MIGHELGGRYEIITRVGGGGMALVYKAHDVLLNRFVAVKVLRQQFVHDEEFIRRFRREAQSAAALSHPNVVSIYDVGQEDDTHYIVMEYVEGNNLNEIIKERAPLQAEEAVRIAIQICDALEHAHHNQIIHRDIKPHNILIGKNGRVKVTDFGIARAVTSSTITQTGSMVGSVHYFSPEHAKGSVTGEKSDLYSLGIVLYQMLTGKLPFLGESPISVALKHLQENFEEPRELNPYIPQSVENVILKAMRKNQNERYRSASEMLRDLETCLQPERLREPKIEFGHPDFDETRVMPAIRGSISDTLAASAISAKSDHATAADRPERERQERERAVPDRQMATTAAARPDAPEGKDDRWDASGMEDKRKRKWVKPVVTVASTLIIIVLVYWGAMTVLGWFDIKEVEVPNVVNMTETDARTALEQAGLKVEEPTIRTDKEGVAKDIVYEQSKPNQRVKVGAFIKLYVSTGPKMATASNYLGKLYEDVEAELVGLGVSKDNIAKEEIYSDEAPGTILEQTPAAGEEFDPKKASFKLTVSQGKETFKMPKVIDKMQSAAISQLRSLGLTVNEDDIVYEKSYKPKGTVLAQYPYDPDAEVAKGAPITLTISSGLPEDALEYTFNMLISPAKAGKTSEIRIYYTDATGEKIEWGKRNIKDTQPFSVNVTLAPNTEATVTIMRDKQVVDSFSKTYEDVKSGADSPPETVPGQDEPPADQPAQAEENPTNGSTNTTTNSPTNTGTDQGTNTGTGTDGGTDATVEQ
ncbi:Stk1 family PASTA domain-containing Ser/Thr kinase [Paenibacillus rhizovicinus]|uniref:Serine/threonine-protein kinase PrkC n=1 Tax=Paenibacillus rhizovicinus TaxID=2704463 RepID=A0A6C0P7P9_9BACL|nr:Stk1 family PASTA domain-containing Ser/Thr kinase [Paenibacillus rhizovicinus]QHW34405.1 Stk1 family PASTA domain-containing Ser/Thr kinase [Paenibacillus rhizovicinus]